MDPQLLAFLGIATIITLTPGADTLLIIRNVLARGPGAGFFTGVGIYAGLACHATLAILGLSAILVRSAALFQGVKLLGAAYLCYLGLRSLWGALRERRNESDSALPAVFPSAVTRISPSRSIREGFLSNILNPKVAVFYLAFLPQFVNPGDPVRPRLVLLAAIHLAIGIPWLALLIIFVGWLRAWLLRPTVRRRMEALSGTILVAVGVRLALERR